MAIDLSSFKVQKRGQVGKWTSTGVRTYTTVLQCLSDDPMDNQVTVLEATCAYLGIPLNTPVYEIFNIGNGFDFLARLKSMEARCTATGSVGEYREWLVTLEYDSTAEQQQDNPLLRPTQISGSFQEYMKTLEKDRDGNPVVNAAKEKFDPPIELPDGRPHLTMVRNEATYDMAYFANNFYNFINSTPWYSGSAGRWRCVNVGGTGPHIENDVVFYTITYEFQYRKEGWQPSILNRGKKDKSGNPCVDNRGNETDDPQLLKSDGTQVSFPIQDGDENYIDVKGFFETDFNALSLP